MTEKLKQEFEKIAPEWFDESAIIVPQEQIYRLDYKGARLYLIAPDQNVLKRYFINDKLTKEDIHVCTSVTTITGRCCPTEHFLKEYYKNNTKEYVDWKFKQTGDYGTFLHTLYDKIILREEIPFKKVELERMMDDFFLKENKKNNNNRYNTDEVLKWMHDNKRSFKKDIFGFVNWVNDFQVKPISIEYPVYNIGYKVASRIDLVCNLKFKGNNHNSIVDYKSGFYDSISHRVQLASYMDMFNKLDLDIKIDKIFNLYSKSYRLPIGKTVTPYNFVERDYAKYVKLWHMWRTQNNLLFEEPKVTFTDFSEQDKISVESDLSTIIENVNIVDNFVDNSNKEEF